jgi:hypothetical protein
MGFAAVESLPSMGNKVTLLLSPMGELSIPLAGQEDVAAWWLQLQPLCVPAYGFGFGEKSQALTLESGLRWRLGFWLALCVLSSALKIVLFLLD